MNRQRDHSTLGGEHEHFFLLKVALEALHELVRIGDLGLPVDDAIEPIDVLGRRVFFVGPVRSDSPFGTLVHFACANLHLDGLAVGPDNRGVQALVQVELRHCDVVLEPAYNGLPTTMNTTERCVAIFDRVGRDADCDEVEDLIEVTVLLDHLFVDAPHVLAATGDLGMNTKLSKS